MRSTGRSGRRCYSTDGRSGLLRWYEKPMLAVCGLLITVLLLMVGWANMTQSPAGEDLRSTVGQGASEKDAPDFLCGVEGQRYLRSSGDSNSGAAVESGGRFALYGAVDSRGKPTRNSHEILRGCDPGLSFNNYVTLQVGDSAPEPAGLSNLLSPTAVSAGGTRATTRYEFSHDVTMTQQATLEESGLIMSYELTNTSDADQTLTFRSLLTPAVASKEQEVLFTAKRSPEAQPTEVVRELTLRLSDDRIESISVARRGASSDSSATWRLGSLREGASRTG